MGLFGKKKSKRMAVSNSIQNLVETVGTYIDTLFAQYEIVEMRKVFHGDDLKKYNRGTKKTNADYVKIRKHLEEIILNSLKHYDETDKINLYLMLGMIRTNRVFDTPPYSRTLVDMTPFMHSDIQNALKTAKVNPLGRT
ncbi:MAG: hypothetical protein FWE38_00325 [Firmicutes bacterium]|nr:hypothetical protein [Bacillota bacterium]